MRCGSKTYFYRGMERDLMIDPNDQFSLPGHKRMTSMTNAHESPFQ